MSSYQSTVTHNQPLGDEFRSHLVKYQPKKASELNFKMSASNFETLLDQLYGASTELYNLFKKVLMNESTDEEYHEYNKLLEATGVMRYNYSRLYGN